jgi:tetratricopeptide (TPR) repeat protein
MRAPRLTTVALLFIGTTVAQNARVLNEEGSRSLAKGDLASALARFQRAARLEPANTEIQFNIGLALVRMGQPKNAFTHLQRAAADPSLAPESHYLLGTAHFAAGDYANVATQLSDLRTSAHAEHVLYMLEESYRLTGRVAEARETFRELNRRFPDSSWTHYLLGEAHENQSENEKAIEEYKNALHKDAAQPNANFVIGYIYWRDHNYEAAKLWLEKQLAVQPCHALASYYLGEIARTDQDLNSAERFYRRAIGCDEHNAKAHIGLGIVLGELTRSDEAVRELQRAIRLDPKNTTPHYRLAVLYGKLGRKGEAEAEYARVKQMQAAARQDTRQQPQPVR